LSLFVYDSFMGKFKKGDVLWGTERKFQEAWHPIVYISGPSEAPVAVVLTSEGGVSCNVPLHNIYRDNDPSHFIDHLIQKMAEWGPYEKFATLKQEDLELIERHMANKQSITWFEYQEYSRNGCPEHPKH